MTNKNLKYLTYILLVALTVYLAWLYRAELNIASELNDNTFQFAMVAQMERIFDLVASGKLSFWYLFDNWNQIWGQGAPLAFYYNHLPQLLTVISHKILHLVIPNLTLYRYFEIIKYAFLVLTPVSFFLGAKLLDFSDFASLGAALIAGFISTYGSYGLDASSYLFAGFGLTSQLTAVFLMPLAFGAIFRGLIQPKKKIILAAVLLNFLVLQSHIGMGTILLISEVFLVVSFGSSWLDLKSTLFRAKNLIIIFLAILAAAAYFLIPMILADAYRNYSHWEGLWKYNSFGWQKVLADLFNGQLFDYQRLPIITGLGLLGLFGVLVRRQKWAFLSLGFVFWLVMFFGRTTWGPVFDMLPGLKDFYLHRFIVGIHFFGIFLAGLAIEFIVQTISKYLKKLSPVANNEMLAFGGNLIVLVILVFLLIPPVRKYAQNNQRLISNAKADFAKDETDFETILASLAKNNPETRRIYAGTPGNWGRSFTVGQTPVYQRLSVLGWPVMNFYAHSWSLSSETEPFFEDNRVEHYQTYNVGFMIAPNWYKAPGFAQKLASAGKYELYQIETEGYFQAGQAGPMILGRKDNLINLVQLWQKSNLPGKKYYPLLSLGNNQADYRLIDLNHYQNLKTGEILNLWESSPLSLPAVSITPPVLIQENTTLAHQQFSAQIDNPGPETLLVLSQSYHPNWQAFLDGQPTSKLMVFPGFLAIKVPPGSHQAEFVYQPNNLKKILLVMGILFLSAFFILKDRRTNT